MTKTIFIINDGNLKITHPNKATFRANKTTFRLGAIFIMLAVALFSFGTLADDHSAGERSRDEIVVGSELDYPPYALVTADGQADGFSVDLMKAVSDVMGIKVIFRVGPWNEVRKALEDGKVDALPLVSYSEEREKVFDFTSPHTASYAAVFKRKGSPKINSVEEMRGKSIVAMRSDATHDWLLRNNISENLSLTKTVPETLRMLASGQHDFALAPRLVGLITAKNLGLTNIEITGPRIDAYGRGFGFAVKEGDFALLSQLNQGLAIIKETGRYDEIYEKWFGLVDPKGTPSAVIIRYVTWGAGAIAVLFSLTLAWIVTLRRIVAQQTAELRNARDDLEKKVEERTAELKEEIAERKRVEAALRNAKAEAEMANKFKTEFLANMSHDLRTPLNAIMGFAEMMEAKTFGSLGDPHYEEYAKDIRKSGNLLINLIDDILDISKVESGKYELNERNLDVPSLIQNSVKMISALAKKGELRLATYIDPYLPMLRGDAKSITQVLNNLLSNAIKFTPSNGKITISAKMDGDGSINVLVADTGEGMSRSDINKALKPFEQADSFHSKRHEGTGLGLHLCKKLIKLHGGDIKLQSKVGKGTTVTINFPPERTVEE